MEEELDQTIDDQELDEVFEDLKKEIEMKHDSEEENSRIRRK